jgi:hypothetical protein
MPTIYRSMLAEEGKPKIGCSATSLGVRVPPDKNSDVPVDADGTVQPNTGGMSVSPGWRSLPVWRIPRRLRGKIEGASGSPKLFCWRMGTGPFVEDAVAEDLVLKPDSATHGTVQPERPMALSVYQGALANTRDQWVIDAD